MRTNTQTYTSTNGSSIQLHRGTPPTMRYNIRLQDRSSASDTISVLQLVADMKEKGVAADIMTYHCLMNALSARLLHKEAWAVFYDMIALGLRPDAQIFNSLIYVSCVTSEFRFNNE